MVDEERKKKRWAVFNVEKVLQYENQKAQRVVQKYIKKGEKYLGKK